MSLRISRRALMGSAAATGASLAAPGLLRAAQAPQITHGLQSGDIAQDGAMIWARADRAAKMMVELSTTESFADPIRVQPLDVTGASDFAGKMELTGLPSDQDIFYRVKFADLAEGNLVSEAQTGRFRTAPTEARDVTFVWSGDTAGQGWGIDEDRGGMLTYAAMLNHRPDFFIHSGDTIYADGPLSSEQKMPNGEMWKNVTTEAKSKVAETLDEFRGNYLYNMLDKNVRAFNAEVPMIAQWDDHETLNNWYPSEILELPRYEVKSAGLLAARTNRAFREMMPMRESWVEPGRIYRKISYGPLVEVFVIDMRTYRDDNGANNEADEAKAKNSFLGAEQMAWLRRELNASKALWKVIAADMPIGMIVYDNWKEKNTFENGSNGDGPVMGREFDIAEVLRFIKHDGIRNTVWLTADVHYTAAHHYSPERAQFQDFDPFWEFVSGPLHAGTFGPNDYDNTFGPEVVFAKHPSKEQGVNLPPSEGFQFFGKVDISGETGVMTVSLMDMADKVLWSKELEPARG